MSIPDLIRPEELPPKGEAYLSLKVAAAMAGVTTQTIRHWAVAGTTSYGLAVRARRDGQRWLIPESVARVTAQHKKDPASRRIQLEGEMYLSTKAAAGTIGVSAGTVRRWAMAGMTSYGLALTVRLKGGRWLIPESDAGAAAQYKKEHTPLPFQIPPMPKLPPCLAIAFGAACRRVISQGRTISQRPKP
jgi:hypothetical protein